MLKRHGGTNPSPWGLLLFALSVSLCFIVAASASSHGPSHRHHDTIHRLVHEHEAVARDSPKTTAPKNDSRALFESALPAMRAANKYRTTHPRMNTWKFPPSQMQSTETGNKTTRVSLLDMRSVLPRDDARTPKDYYVPDELAEAAKQLAESSQQESMTGDHEQAVSKLKMKYWTSTNDTNAPEPKTSDSIEKRDDTSYWMEFLEMNGQAPYADEDGYVVFRNVKDYGAKGDGVTDDTAAINKAVTDGNRCGPECGSTTAKPAVVYFPSGSYLVSSSIIQYYNTQFIGNPLNRPKILAASSFVGLGVMSSNVYIDGGDGAEWYIPQNNFMRAIRNFIIDITNTDPNAYICGIHWQIAQATDLQNIDFFMKSGTTQQGIYMENGSGGSFSELYFHGGNFGAYLGNQQFTSRNLIFEACKTAVQIHWDWAWTMHSTTILGSTNDKGKGSVGIIIVGGAGGAGSTGQGVGSFVLIDSQIGTVDIAIQTSLKAENSTSFLLQNVEFDQTPIGIQDADKGIELLKGTSGQMTIESWGFGNIVDGDDGKSSFQNGNTIKSTNRTTGLTVSSTRGQRKYFGRNAPTYKQVAANKFINIRSMGAKGDATADDSAIINQVLRNAANTSSVVFFPFGVYNVKDTIYVPPGARIVGQAWSQIRATGTKFHDVTSPRPVVQVGRDGDSGIVEISDMSISVQGSCAGAVLIEWNVHESTQGSAAIWNTPVRVGGDVGSSLRAQDCPKLTGKVNKNCIGAAMLIHLTPKSSAYLDNVWAWTADHDLESLDQTQIDIYVARGILIESQKPTWLWGVASEHNVLYQYQLSNAKNVFVSMFQSETPYFQPTPRAPAPFTPGLFPNDPTFDNCPSNARGCPMAWAVRLVDSSDIFIYSSGLYSFFTSYTQTCVTNENCQRVAVGIEQTSSLWWYSLATKAFVQMVSPYDGSLTLASPNQNGYLASILAWLAGAEETIGRRFEGWPIFANGTLKGIGLSQSCENALYQKIKCDDSARSLMYSDMVHAVGNDTLLGSICDTGCKSSIQDIRNSVATACKGTPDLMQGIPLVNLVDMIQSRWNETCLIDPTTKRHCNAVMEDFKSVDNISDMPKSEMCSYCNLQRFAMMQKSPYSAYDNDTVKTQYEYMSEACGKVVDLEPADPVFDPSFNFTHTECGSNRTYITSSGDTCNSISSAKNVSSSSLFWINTNLLDCDDIPAETELCLPQSCGALWTVQEAETCFDIKSSWGLTTDVLLDWNAGLNCSKLHTGLWGNTLCVLPPGGDYISNTNSTGSLDPWDYGDGYLDDVVDPPENAMIADGTTLNCGGWYVAEEDVACVDICMEEKVVFSLFIDVNPSLRNGTCDSDLVVGNTYCVHPASTWNETLTDPSTSPPPTSGATSLPSQTATFNVAFST